MAEVNTGATIQIARVGAHGLICGPAFGSGAAVACDPYWNQTSSYVSFAGPNGGTSFPDDTGLQTWAPSGGLAILVAGSVFGTGAGNFGAGSVLTTPNNSNFNFTGDFTVEQWINPTLINAVRVLWGGAAALPGSFVLYINAGNLQCAQVGGSIVLTSGVGITAAAWQYVSVSRQGANLYMHIGGVQVGTVADANNYTGVGVANYMFGDNGGGNQFLGLMNYFRATKGVGRYGAANYVVPTGPFPTVQC